MSYVTQKKVTGNIIFGPLLHSCKISLDLGTKGNYEKSTLNYSLFIKNKTQHFNFKMQSVCHSGLHI